MKWVREIQPRAGRNFFAVLFAAGAVNFGVFLMVRFSLRVVCDSSDAKKNGEERDERERPWCSYAERERGRGVSIRRDVLLRHG
jgi:hypothetical protein